VRQLASTWAIGRSRWTCGERDAALNSDDARVSGMAQCRSDRAERLLVDIGRADRDVVRSVGGAWIDRCWSRVLPHLRRLRF